jgi:hypothetical protein
MNSAKKMQAMAYYQRQQFENIEELYKAKGEAVQLDDLNQWGINLHRPVEFKIKDKQYTLYFHHYGVQQMPEGKFKIFTHELH